MTNSKQEKALVPDVSVIVPVFNMQEYLEKCLGSLEKQTLENIEVIIVDDGSTDGSKQIYDSFVRRDPRFSVIHKENEGLSAARNDGLAVARGRYIMFVDSDDWVEPEFCEMPFHTAEETGAELVAFLRVWHSNNASKQQEPFPAEGITDKGEALTNLWQLVGVIAWNKLYHRRLFEGERYPVGRLSEDTALTHRLIYNAEEVFLLNRYLYHHRTNRPGSIMSERSRQMITDELVFNLQRMKDLKQWGYHCQREETGYALSYLMTFGRKAELSSQCDEILHDASSVPEGGLSWKQKAMIRMYRFVPGLFDMTSIMFGKRIQN